MPDNNTYFHLTAFRGSVGIGVLNAAIAAVADNALTRSAGNAVVAPQGATIFAGVGGGVNASRSRINTPVIRAIGNPYLAPLNTGITAPSPPNIAVFGPGGPMPAKNDEISVEATHTDAGAQIQFALLWLMFGRREPRGGRRHRLRFTAAITGVVGSWASGAITLDQNLPSGTYEIQGMDVFGTNLLGARLIFPGGGWRPGVLGRNAVGSVPHPLGTDGSLGVFGDFDSINVPQLEVFVEAANSAQEGYLDVAKVM